MEPHAPVGEASARPRRSGSEPGLWLALGVLAALVAILVVPESLYRMTLLLVALGLVARVILPWRWLRAVVGALTITLLLLVATLTALLGAPHIAVSAPSPDGQVVAELVETGLFVDRHFMVRLTTYWLGFLPVSSEIYESPDEGPRGGERFLWSRDGRHVLLVGTNLSATDEACLASGEALYLLVDRLTGTLRSNANQNRGSRFSLDDLAGMDFGVPLVRGVRAPHAARVRCAPATRSP